MIRDELRKLPTGPRELRRFGLLVGGVFALLALWCAWRQKPWHGWLWVPAAPLLILGLVRPTTLRLAYRAWMTVAMLLGHVVSTVLLVALFFVVITPLGLLARLCGQDFLRRRIPPGAPTYWLARDPSRTRGAGSYERQF